MARKTPLKKSQVELLFFSGLILGGLVFCAILLTGIVKGGQKETVTELRERVASGQGVLNREAQIQSFFSAGASDLEELAEFVPKASDPYAWAYEYISQRARRAGISLKEIKEMERGKGDEESLFYKIHIQMNCSYAKTLHLLKQLEEDNPLLLVAQLEINAEASNPMAHPTTMLLQWPLDFVIETGK